jgi:cellobiose phosphorylase
MAETGAGRADLALAAVESQLPEMLHRRNAAAAPFYYAEKYLTPGDEPWLCTWAGDPTLIDLLLTGFLGVRPGLDGLRIEPSLPADWAGENVAADFVWHGADWQVIVDSDAIVMTVDGVETNKGLVAPAQPGTSHVIRVPISHRTDARQHEERMLHG